MSMVEVEAVLSFGLFKQGRRYQFSLDGSDSHVQALIHAGYLKVTAAAGETVAADAAGLVPDPGVDAGVAGPRKRGRPRKAKPEEVTSDQPDSNEVVGELEV